ncbi:phosphonate ABC transporter, permease protein PhnE [Pseudogemmobacter sp. W21_MBD1_M6]|uniref:phosphonate ABC transporter, permease protein PhnE n=1 Tax=Pseudogemmobacter sp. W21_MBD1_M6 TaxID=3240271 RepID=UPI003F96D42F
MTATDLTLLRGHTDRQFLRKRLLSFGIPALFLAYLVYVFFAFDIARLADRARMDNAATLVADSYSYKTHVTRDNRSGEVSIAIEGERRGTFGPDQTPDWVTLGQTTQIDLGKGNVVVFAPEAVTFDVPGYGVITAVPSRSGVTTTLPAGPVPDWINVGDTRLAVTTDAGRLSVTRNRSEVFRYSLGWEMFFFTLDSPFYGKSLSELAALAVTGPRLTVDRSNIGAMVHGVWTNSAWRHNDVAWALFETVLMAFLGTFGAAIIALPLAFAAARNFSVFGPLRFAVRRVFDLLRGVDGLIWTILLSRAFGPGPLTGALAIMLTDTGTFGKLFSEAVENVDEKQIEGVTSTGAKPLQRYRFGVVPQIVPVLLSQILYYLESNTRSATVIGAITGGGIGLLLTQAIVTQRDWEEVTYYIVLIILMVMAMDWLSGILRRRLIKGD